MITLVVDDKARVALADYGEGEMGRSVPAVAAPGRWRRRRRTSSKPATGSKPSKPGEAAAANAQDWLP